NSFPTRRSSDLNKEADYYFEKLLHQIKWKNDKAIIFGKEIITKRKVAWYGDKPFEYTYSNTTKLALPWTKELLELKHKIETQTRSEEHTSELQSRENLVCRLLLEKKN